MIKILLFILVWLNVFWIIRNYKLRLEIEQYKLKQTHHEGQIAKITNDCRYAIEEKNRQINHIGIQKVKAEMINKELEAQIKELKKKCEELKK